MSLGHEWCLSHEFSDFSGTLLAAGARSTNPYLLGVLPAPDNEQDVQVS